MTDTQYYFSLSHRKVQDHNHSWLWPEEALDLYGQNELMLCPSLASMLHLLSLLPSHGSLQRLKPHHALLSTNRPHYYDFQDLPEEDLRTLVKKLFDKSDLLSDSERADSLHVRNFPSPFDLGGP